jgi:hypothetical protein
MSFKNGGGEYTGVNDYMGSMENLTFLSSEKRKERIGK